MLLKCCFQYARKFGKLSSGHRTGKGQFSFQSQRKAMPKKCSNYHTIAFISHTTKVMLKILQARLQQYMDHELPDVQAGFRKDRGTRDQIANICWIIEKAREFQKIWKTQQWPQDWKRSVFIPLPKKGNAKECSNYHTIALISHTSKVKLKIL